MSRLGQYAQRELRRALARLGNVGLSGLVRAIWRALALNLGRPAVASRSRPERVVITLSTTPPRATSLGTTLRSLLDQSEPADRVLLALPFVTRGGAPYADAQSIALPAGVDVLRCTDEGPATKLLPALQEEPEALLIVVDDDVIYPRNFVETLLREHRLRPDAAIGYRGVRLSRGVAFSNLDHVFATGISEPAQVDVLFGTWGYLLPVGAFDEDVFKLDTAPAEMRWVDDIWFSGQLARRGVPRWVVSADQLPLDSFNALRSSLTGGVNASGHNDETGLRYFWDSW